MGILKLLLNTGSLANFHEKAQEGVAIPALRKDRSAVPENTAHEHDAIF